MHQILKKPAGGTSGPALVSAKAHPLRKKRAVPVGPKACPVHEKRGVSDSKEARDKEVSGAGDNGGAGGTASLSGTRDLLDRFQRLQIQGQLQGATGKATLDELRRRRNEIVVEKYQLDMEKVEVDKAIASSYFNYTQVKKEERVKEKKVKKSSSEEKKRKTKGLPLRDGSYSVTDSEDSTDSCFIEGGRRKRRI